MSKSWLLCAALLASLVGAGCGTDAETGEQSPNATEFAGFEYGFFYNYDYAEGAARPLALAFHDVETDLPSGYAGHFDFTTYNDDSGDLSYKSGVFKLYRYDGQTRVRLDTYDGQDAGRYAWSFADGTLTLGEFAMTRTGVSGDALKECEAFDVPDLFCEEGFTPWEYPTVSVENAQGGGYNVTFGSCTYGAEDGDTVEVTTAENGDFEARLVTSYGETYVVSVPAGEPSRGTVLHGAEPGAELVTAAYLVCH
jgi:hypothetical protein